MMLVLGVGLLGLALIPAWAAAANQGGGWGPGWRATDDPITLAEAEERATAFLADAGLADLQVGEVMQFDNHFYVAVVDPVSGEGAFELLVSLNGQRVHLEPGPSMLWNTTYSPMIGSEGAALQDALMADMPAGGMMGSGMMSGAMSGGMMGGRMNRTNGNPEQCVAQMPGLVAEGATLAQPLTTEGAVALAQEWLAENRPGTTAAEPIAFPGYVTVHLESDGQITGMLSVQTSTGAVWEHGWHGEYVASSDETHGLS
jgi:hypothetical protein